MQDNPFRSEGINEQIKLYVFGPHSVPFMQCAFTAGGIAALSAGTLIIVCGLFIMGLVVLKRKRNEEELYLINK